MARKKNDIPEIQGSFEEPRSNEDYLAFTETSIPVSAADKKAKSATNFNRLLSVKDGFPNRKAWEIDMALKTLEKFGAIRSDAEILGVGAGTERTIFELSNRVKRVFATDLYGDSGVWSQTAPPDMLKGNFKTVAKGAEFNPRRIVVQHMDMLNLQYEDDSFDGIFSSGSIEHVGSFEGVAKAACEIGRVLKPGGIATISTEFKISGNGDGWAGVLLFTPEKLQQYIIEASGLDLVDEPTWTQPVDDDTMATAHKLYDIVVHKKMPKVEGVLLEHGFAFTSVHLALIKGVG